MFSEYLEHGLGIIPITGKRPFFEGWQRYCEQLPTEEEASLWTNRHSHCGIGLPLGPANRLVAIDIDSFDQETLRLAPPSPLVKRGRKGETRFFKFNPEIKNQVIGAQDSDPRGWIDVLSTGKQTVLPPSIHPDTQKPYEWTGPCRLPEFDIENLPELTYEALIPVSEYLLRNRTQQKTNLKGIFTNDDPGRQSPHGAQERLKTLAVALIYEKTPIDIAVQKLFDYDSEHHKPIGYFSERGRTSDQVADPYTNAIKFYTSILTSINKDKNREGESPVIPNQIEIKEIDFSQLKQSKPKSIPYPRARGLMGEIQNLCQEFSDIENGPLGLGASIAICATIFSNRFQAKIATYNVTPNVYVLNVAKTGGGKEAPQRAARFLLDGHRDEALFGTGGYGSAQGAILGLAKQQQRLDVIDEISSVFRSVKSGTATHETSIGETLCNLWTAGHDRYAGSSTVKHGERAGACLRPHLNILGSTTPSAFKATVSAGMTKTGLMPRFLVFTLDHAVQVEMPEHDSSAQVYEQVADFLKIYPLQVDESYKRNLISTMGLPYAPRILGLSDAATKRFKELRSQEIKYIEDSSESFENDFMVRRFQHIGRLALNDAVSLGRSLIEVDSIEWAINVFDAQWENIKSVYEQTTAENQTEADLIKAKQVIRAAGTISKSEFLRRTHWLSRRRDEVIQALKESDIIEEVLLKSPMGKAGLCYRMKD